MKYSEIRIHVYLLAQMCDEPGTKSAIFAVIGSNVLTSQGHTIILNNAKSSQNIRVRLYKKTAFVNDISSLQISRVRTEIRMGDDSEVA